MANLTRVAGTTNPNVCQTRNPRNRSTQIPAAATKATGNTEVISVTIEKAGTSNVIQNPRGTGKRGPRPPKMLRAWLLLGFGGGLPWGQHNQSLISENDQLREEMTRLKLDLAWFYQHLAYQYYQPTAQALASQPSREILYSAQGQTNPVQRSELGNGQFYRRVGDRLVSYRKITVDRAGNGNFSAIQAAINSVPSGNKFWVSINVKAGTYREKLKIPYDKPYIILKGEGKRKTIVVWDDHDTVAQSPTFTSMADNVVVKCMSFRNSYNNPINSNPRQPAVAAMVAGDKTRFFRVGFFGLQDTLWDDQGRHYYKLCTIQGAVDFIFGAGQSLFERCSISVIGGALEAGLPGFITAQGRTNPNDANGFVFKECNVFGNGSTYLGRPWRAYSRVLFYRTNMSNIVQPKGWEPWNFVGQENQITFAEYGCYGDGSDTSERVKWTKKLDVATVEQMTSMSFIDSEGWLQTQIF
ncbi:putative pectinesterase 29 [Senna tora]|uniref:Pectinesterase n=1 Tax=Senna tora TaxID=362788 RepID=A0A834T1F0_9FABA|nr:putative pectinesterase 29 [Senna tora]